VPEKYGRLVQDIYKNLKTLVRCSIGDTEKFTVEVGHHQVSALSPYLFILVMDVITEEISDKPPENMKQN
jgi:hypothetical protein